MWEARSFTCRVQTAEFSQRTPLCEFSEESAISGAAFHLDSHSGACSVDVSPVIPVSYPCLNFGPTPTQNSVPSWSAKGTGDKDESD